MKAFGAAAAELLNAIEHKLDDVGTPANDHTKETVGSHLAIVDYFKSYNAGWYEMVADDGGDLTFQKESLWMDMKEKAEGLEPIFLPDGTRLYHRYLLRWMDLHFATTATD